MNVSRLSEVLSNANGCARVILRIRMPDGSEQNFGVAASGGTGEGVFTLFSDVASIEVFAEREAADREDEKSACHGCIVCHIKSQAAAMAFWEGKRRLDAFMKKAVDKAKRAEAKKRTGKGKR